ncbi:MAG: hypothetical protein ACYCX2_01035 [Christensenellales bacterium]
MAQIPSLDNSSDYFFRWSHIAAHGLQLYISIIISRDLMGMPLFGGVFYLLLFMGLLAFVRFRDHASLQKYLLRMVMVLFFILELGLGAFLLLVYPAVINQPTILFCLLLISLMMTQTILIHRLNRRWARSKSHFMSKTIFILASAVIFFIFCAIALKGMSLVVIAVNYLTACIISIMQRSDLIDIMKNSRLPDTEIMEDVYSYKLFSAMSLLSNIAFYLGMMLYICYMSFLSSRFTVWQTYGIIVGWIALVYGAVFLFYRLILHRGKLLKFGLYAFGAASWIFSGIMMFRTTDAVMSILWTLFWAFGLAAMYAVMTQLNDTFKLVAQLAGEDVENKTLRQNTVLLQCIAFLIASIITLYVLTVWNFVIPGYAATEIPTYYRTLMTLLPMAFMLSAIGCALRQPLDDKNRQRLLQFFSKKERGEPTKKKLKAMLIYRYQVRFGVKIIIALLRPVLRIKVYGSKNMDYKHFPSIFVCNHEQIYGPLAAAMYMPIYFRPWIHRSMLDPQLIVDHLYTNTFSKWRLFTQKQRLSISRFVAAPVRWAMNSFDPIPVERNRMRDVMNTFRDTVSALLEDDNVLLFPENPERSEDGQYAADAVGEFFTGFAHIGKLYYEKTGKEVYFYPVFANKKKRTFTIDKPVKYNAGNPSREEKLRIAREIRNAMLNLSRQ